QMRNNFQKPSTAGRSEGAQPDSTGLPDEFPGCGRQLYSPSRRLRRAIPDWRLQFHQPAAMRQFLSIHD
ncbi:MAG: hypothetical protein RMJ55_01865, partial [Roseiflexaceae bacterium]|nr:hypothetical protein [Roseiflexaceae bacterium]